MKLVLSLALRDLLFQRVHLICNVAILAGVLVPLLVLFGVKNGVYDALIGRLLSNPATLQIDTSGNELFLPADAETVRAWPETGFVTLKTRSLFDYVNVRLDGGREKRDALLIPSGTGDPNLPEGVTLTPWLDQAELLQSRQDLLVRNGLSGFVLVVLVLALFLRFKLAIWVSLGIPISFLGGIFVAYLLGISMNMMTMFALIVVLGDLASFAARGWLRKSA